MACASFPPVIAVEEQHYPGSPYPQFSSRATKQQPASHPYYAHPPLPPPPPQYAQHTPQPTWIPPPPPPHFDLPTPPRTQYNVPPPPPPSSQYSDSLPPAPAPPTFERSKREGHRSVDNYYYDDSDISDDDGFLRVTKPPPHFKRTASDSHVYNEARAREHHARPPHQRPLTPPYLECDRQSPAEELEQLKEQLMMIQTELAIQQYRDQPKEYLPERRRYHRDEPRRSYRESERRSRSQKHYSSGGSSYEWEKVIVVPASRSTRHRHR